MLIAPRRGYGCNRYLVHCTELGMKPADRALLAGVMYESAVKPCTYSVST